MLTALDEIKKGTIALDTILEVPKKEILEGTKVFEHGPTKCSLEELLNWMIINSDNTATNVLIEHFKIDTIDKYIKETLNLKNTTLQRKMLDFDAIKNGKNNYISQNDMYITFNKIFNKTILTPKLCNKAIEILRNQRSKTMITRYIYQNVLFANKPGSLEGLINDSGVMCINKKLYYVGIFIHNYKTKEEALKLMGTLGVKINFILNQNGSFFLKFFLHFFILYSYQNHSNSTRERTAKPSSLRFRVVIILHFRRVLIFFVE